LDYAAQLEAKRAIVRDALTRIANVDVDSLAIVPSPLETSYRNRVSFTLERAGPNRVIAGFNALHDAGRLIDVDGRCLLPEAPVSRVWDRLRAAWGPDANLLPDGKRLRLTLRASAGGNVSLLIDGGDSPGNPDALLAAVAGLDAIWHRPRDQRAIHLAGARQMPEQWGDESIALGGAAFVQVNRTAAALLEHHVAGLVGVAAGRRIVDAYCGVGLHGRRLARCGADVVGIELDPDAARVAQQAGLGNLSILVARVEDVLAQALPADVLILNPPRAGVAPRVIEQIVAGTVGRIVYVSCDPATLARDIKRLASRFTLTHARAFDLFPQTAHVETVAVLDADSG
jgi:23S rRNA (uracil1939-C5)-methyltransferase